MTISSQTRKAGPFIGAGSTGPFAFTFKVFQASDLLVVTVNTTTQVETTLTLTTNYTVSLNSDQNTSPGGSVTLVSPLAVGNNMVISSQVPYLQETDLTNQGGFYPEVITDALDKLTIEAQQLKEGVDRAAKIPITSEADPESLVEDLIRLADSADNIDIVANNIADVNTVAGNINDVTVVSGVADDVVVVSGISADVTSVADNEANINIVAGNIDDVQVVSGIAADVSAVAAIDSDVTAVAADEVDIGIVSGNIGSVVSVASIIADVIVVADNDANITVVAGIDSEITTVSGIAADVTTTASNDANITIVATNIASVNEAGGNINSVITVATNILDVNNFADVYIGAASSAPSTRADGSALEAGDLYFNTSDNQMKVYDGSAWGSVGSTVNGTSQRYRYIATASQTTFTGSDSNGNTLAYDAGFIDVYLNGVRLDQTDYTANSGTSVVLNVGATADDELNIVAYGNFELADVYTKAQSDARYQLLDADTAKLDVEQTWSANQNFADYLVQRPVLKDYAIEGSAIGNVGATRTFDLETANFFSATLDQACTFTFSNPAASGDFCGFVLEITDGGAYVITYPASVDWVGGTPPTLTAAGVDQLVFTTRDAGTTWRGFVVGLDIK
jgi:hypothetical protein